MEIKRGGVYYIDNPTFTGHEMAKDRPAVVVSCDAMNCTSSVVSVVYMTGSKPADTPYRVRISAARSVRHGDSTALCDHIYTVDISRVGKYMGQCSQEEMDAIDNALLMTMGLGDGGSTRCRKKRPLRSLARPHSLRHIPCRAKRLPWSSQRRRGTPTRCSMSGCWTA